MHTSFRVAECARGPFAHALSTPCRCCSLHPPDPATGDSFPGPGVDLFDDAASTCLELIKGNYFFPFQSSKQFERYKAEKQQREDEQARADAEAQQAAKKKGKSGACVIL